jgi:hypothetical protein
MKRPNKPNPIIRNELQNILNIVEDAAQKIGLGETESIKNSIHTIHRHISHADIQ